MKEYTFEFEAPSKTLEIKASADSEAEAHDFALQKLGEFYLVGLKNNKLTDKRLSKPKGRPHKKTEHSFDVSRANVVDQIKDLLRANGLKFSDAEIIGIVAKIEQEMKEQTAGKIPKRPLFASTTERLKSSVSTGRRLQKKVNQYFEISQP